MPCITIDEPQAWLEQTKLTLTSLDAGLEDQISTQTKARLAAAFDVSSWITPAATPKLVRSVIAMLYAAAYYDRVYSEDRAAGNSWADLLRKMAETNITGMIDGTIVIADAPAGTDLGTGNAAFYPNDQSSAQEPTKEDPSLGGARFTFGTVW